MPWNPKRQPAWNKNLTQCTCSLTSAWNYTHMFVFVLRALSRHETGNQIFIPCHRGPSSNCLLLKDTTQPAERTTEKEKHTSAPLLSQWTMTLRPARQLTKVQNPSETNSSMPSLQKNNEYLKAVLSRKRRTFFRIVKNVSLSSCLWPQASGLASAGRA